MFRIPATVFLALVVLGVATSSAASTGLAAGGLTACGPAPSGAVRCWGEPSPWTGEAGTGGASAPRQIAGMRHPSQVAVGGRTACGLDGGRVKCWGRYLGRGEQSVAGTPTAVAVGGLPKADGLSVSGDHACASQRGRAWCWGENSYGELGDGTRTSRLAPAAVRGLSGVRSVAVGNAFSCALRLDSKVWCWGTNGSNQLNATHQYSSRTPRKVPGLPRVVSLNAGSGGACALTAAGATWCWGSSGLSEARHPRRVRGLPRATQVSVGMSHACAVTRAGAIYCWGNRGYGALGVPSLSAPTPHVEQGEGAQPVRAAERVKAPVRVRGIGRASDVAAGSATTCARRRAGAIYCWGNPVVATAGIGAGTIWPVDEDGDPLEVSAPKLVLDAP